MQVVVNWLVETFPKAFFKAKKRVKPLQLGIIEDILDTYERLDVAPFSKKRLRSGLNFYTSSKGYLSSQVEGAFRVNVIGQKVEPVTESQAQYAKDKMVEKYGLSDREKVQNKPVEKVVEVVAQKVEDKPEQSKEPE